MGQCLCNICFHQNIKRKHIKRCSYSRQLAADLYYRFSNTGTALQYLCQIRALSKFSQNAKLQKNWLLVAYCLPLTGALRFIHMLMGTTFQKLENIREITQFQKNISGHKFPLRKHHTITMVSCSLTNQRDWQKVQASHLATCNGCTVFILVFQKMILGRSVSH